MKKVFIADDHRIVREGLVSLLDGHIEFEVIGEARTGVEVLKKVRKEAPDIIIMDAQMPDLNGIEATKQIVEGMPGIKIIGLSMHTDKHFVDGMLSAGAAGYLYKDCAFDDLFDALKTVLNGGKYLSPSIKDVIIGSYVDNVLIKQSNTRKGLLTPREKQILQLLSEGHSTRQIAEILSISIKTVQTHLQQNMRKLNVNNIPALVRLALKENIEEL